MCYRFVFCALACLFLTLPASAQSGSPRPYEVKLKAYISCVEQQFHKNASEIGNTFDSATKAQNTCVNLYDETITEATTTGEPIAAVRDAMERSRKEAPAYMVKDLENLIQRSFISAALSKIFMENCPRIDMNTEIKNRETILAGIVRRDARFRDTALFLAKQKEVEAGQRALLLEADRSPKPELNQWCQVWDTGYEAND